MVEEEEREALPQGSQLWGSFGQSGEDSPNGLPGEAQQKSLKQNPKVDHCSGGEGLGLPKFHHLEWDGRET